VCHTRLSNALDQFGRSKLVTTSFQFDSNGNVVQKLSGGVLTTYTYDYANHLMGVGLGGATTCVYRKLKLGRSNGEARRGSGVNE
jgi:hypothetical protein